VTPAIETSDLGRTFGEREALSGVGLSVPPGTLLGLLGPNGGGKTTLFRILATLLAPSSGWARILGLDVVRSPREVRRRIGVVFQEPALDRQLTVGENLRHQGHLQGMRGGRLRARIAELLESMGLSDRRDELVSRLSGGLARRADLARGLIHGPEVLILDEPTAGLDLSSRRDFGDRLQTLRREGITILLTTHMMEEAAICDRVGILDGGRLVALDTPESFRNSVGREVVSARVEDPKGFQVAVRERLGLESSILEDTVRMECPDGGRAMRDLLAAFHDRILSITLSRPTLEDAFIRHTGHRLHPIEGG
jgi:ABC-2 type transport system ATP-binding protein